MNPHLVIAKWAPQSLPAGGGFDPEAQIFAGLDPDSDKAFEMLMERYGGDAVSHSVQQEVGWTIYLSFREGSRAIQYYNSLPKRLRGSALERLELASPTPRSPIQWPLIPGDGRVSVVIPADFSAPVQVIESEVDPRAVIRGSLGRHIVRAFGRKGELVFDDDGNALQLRPNPRATVLLLESDPNHRLHRGTLVGDAVFVVQPKASSRPSLRVVG